MEIAIGEFDTDTSTKRQTLLVYQGSHLATHTTAVARQSDFR
jgi:hypothetical protein